MRAAALLLLLLLAACGGTPGPTLWRCVNVAGCGYRDPPYDVTIFRVVGGLHCADTQAEAEAEEAAIFSEIRGDRHFVGCYFRAECEPEGDCS